MLRTTACMTRQHRLLTTTTTIIIKNTRKILRAISHSLWFFFCKKMTQTTEKNSIYGGVSQGLDFWKPIWKDDWPGWDQDERFPYVQVGGGVGLILQVTAAQLEHPELTLEKLPSLHGLILHGWTSVLHSQINQTVFQTWKPFLSRGATHQKLPQSAWLPLQADYSSGRGRGWGGGRDLTWKPKEELRRPLLQPESLWFITQFAMVWPLTLGCLSCSEVCAVHAELPDMVLDTEKSGIRVNFLEKTSLVLFFFCFVFW